MIDMEGYYFAIGLAYLANSVGGNPPMKHVYYAGFESVPLHQRLGIMMSTEEVAGFVSYCEEKKISIAVQYT